MHTCPSVGTDQRVRPATLEDSGASHGYWQRVVEHPERWERAGFGAVEARGPGFWAMLPTCGHNYGALTLLDAQRHLDEHEGFCFVCWHRKHAVRKALRRGNATPPDGTPLD
jgi:hypothetical protein